MGSTANSEKARLDEFLIEQARLAIEGARSNLERFGNNELSSVRPLCESAQELEHAASVLHRCGARSDMLQEAEALLRRLRGIDAALLALAMGSHTRTRQVP